MTDTPETEAAIASYANAMSMRLQACARRPAPVFSDFAGRLERDRDHWKLSYSRLSDELDALRRELDKAKNYETDLVSLRTRELEAERNLWRGKCALLTAALEAQVNKDDAV